MTTRLTTRPLSPPSPSLFFYKKRFLFRTHTKKKKKRNWRDGFLFTWDSLNRKKNPKRLPLLNPFNVRNTNLKKFCIAVVSVDGTVFNITRVNRLHMGAYLCIASNGVPPSVSKRIMLIVHFPPMISVPNQLVGAQEGQSMTLECHSEAFPKSINYWTKNNDTIAQG